MAKGRFTIESVFRTIDRMTRPLNKMEGSVSKFARHSVKSMGYVAKATKNVSAEVFGLGKRLTKTGLTLGGVGAIGVTMFNKASVKSEMLAKSVGVSVKTFEGLEKVIEPAGFELEHLVDLAEEMNNKLGESAGLTEILPVTESLAILGLRYKEIKKLKPEEQFKKIMNAALGMADAQKSASAVDILMGGEANKITGLLRERGKTIDEILAAQERFEFRTDRGREGARAFVFELTKMTQGLYSLGAELSGLIGGKVAPIMDSLTEKIAVNKDSIVDYIDNSIKKLGDLALSTKDYLSSFTSGEVHQVFKQTWEITKLIVNVLDYGRKYLQMMFNLGQEIRKVFDQIFESEAGKKIGSAIDTYKDFMDGALKKADDAMGGGVFFKKEEAPQVQTKKPRKGFGDELFWTNPAAYAKATGQITIKNETGREVEASGAPGLTLDVVNSGAFE